MPWEIRKPLRKSKIKKMLNTAEKMPISSLKKAMSILKEEIEAAGMKEASWCRGRAYNWLEEDLKTWEDEFKSKRTPTQAEINYFYL